MPVNVLGINGSSRTDGWTVELLELVLRHARASGARTERLDLIKYPFPHCQANYSRDPKSCGPEDCVQGPWDGFGKIAERLDWADAVVFATPVYWFGPSARIKALIERMTSLENKGIWHAGKPMALVAAAEEDGAANAMAQLAVPLNYMGFTLIPLGMVYTHRRGRRSVYDDPEALADAERIGHNLVKMAELLRGCRWDWEKARETGPRRAIGND